MNPSPNRMRTLNPAPAARHYAMAKRPHSMRGRQVPKPPHSMRGRQVPKPPHSLRRMLETLLEN
jgi:hypothetical protein